MSKWARETELKKREMQSPFNQDNAQSFTKIIEANMNQYISMQRFLSLYGLEKCKDFLKNSDVDMIWAFANSISSLYLNSGISYRLDSKILKDLLEELKSDRINSSTSASHTRIYNQERSRSREMALCMLESYLSRAVDRYPIYK